MSAEGGAPPPSAASQTAPERLARTRTRAPTARPPQTAHVTQGCAPPGARPGPRCQPSVFPGARGHVPHGMSCAWEAMAAQDSNVALLSHLEGQQALGWPFPPTGPAPGRSAQAAGAVTGSRR